MSKINTLKKITTTLIGTGVVVAVWLNRMWPIVGSIIILALCTSILYHKAIAKAYKGITKARKGE